MILKQVTALTMLALAISACGSSGSYGEKFDASKKVDIDKAIADFKSNGTKEAIVEGKISKVCQTEGCWFNYKTSSEDQFVDFDHKFEIPKNTGGKTAISKGYFYYDTTTVEQLKEYAKDDGKPVAEIDAISQPEIRLVFRASGVIIDPKQ